jgi:hypothetical protein
MQNIVPGSCVSDMKFISMLGLKLNYLIAVRFEVSVALYTYR